LSQNQLKILFISHSFPPIFGGVEQQNYHLSESLKKIAEVRVIANGKGKKWLPVFLPVTFFKALFLMSKYDACLLGNGVLAPIGAVVKWFHPQKKFFCVVHGLDITFARKKGFLAQMYKSINIPSLKKVDKLFMVGNHTIDEAEKIGINRNHCMFIPNGINFDELVVKSERADMEKVLAADLANKKVILRIGRFVKHKGVEWFIHNVMPKLPEEYILVAGGGIVSTNAAGDKSYFPECQKAVKDSGLEKRVWLFGNIPEKDKLIFMNAADVYISPNIKVPGSMEGFGITAIEGAACGRVVLASDLEGLKDAIKDGLNGFLIEHENAAAWVGKISEILADDDFRSTFGKKAQQYVRDNFTWERIAKMYLDEMGRIVN
jgi:phosphatidylinositol alpha-1,6-mannosyltransferase